MRAETSLAPLGHSRTLQALQELWAGGQGPRTLLFAGPESVGRRPTARWLAAYVNCAKPAEAPCGVCESCRLLAAGAHPDLKEVTPALTTGSGRAKRSLEIRIDQLVPRERSEPEPLGPWLLTRPRFNVRVGIIDHAEAMNAAAANSLLKLLEEPPAWALVILIAPGPEAVLPTVASRSSTVRFSPVSPEEFATLPGVAPDHPAVRLGQPGILLAAESDARAAGSDAARAAALALLDSLDGDLEGTLQAAEELAATLGSGDAETGGSGALAWLRHSLRLRSPAGYAAALDAVEACEEALTHYAQASLASTVLALELRRIFS